MNKLIFTICAALVFANIYANPASAECQLDNKQGKDEQVCDNKNTEELARQKEYADFEANYTALLKTKNSQRRTEDLVRLKSMSTDEFCITYGEIFRGEKPRIFMADGYSNDELVSIVKKHAKSRRLSFDEATIRQQDIRLGMSKCMLYASLGHPTRESRTIGSWGNHIQHVYGHDNWFVYTENGRVTGWQN